ncbi:hypothetical protein, partial [Albimonas pacifica]|uniref:hypothetical protein n=1 Tax=Albimonas pacifica TaxID=1114924 RepID=UPI001FE9FC21
MEHQAARRGRGVYVLGQGAEARSGLLDGLHDVQEVMQGPGDGVRPFGRTGSGGGFDRGAGVAFLEFDGAEI